MQASRSKGAMSRSSDRRQSAKGLFTSPSLAGLRRSFRGDKPPHHRMNSATVALFALLSAHDAHMYHSALVSYSLRALGEQPLALFRDRTGVYSPHVSDSRRMGAQANQFGSSLGLGRS